MLLQLAKIALIEEIKNAKTGLPELLEGWLWLTSVTHDRGYQPNVTFRGMQDVS